jgi:hypothetical protein
MAEEGREKKAERRRKGLGRVIGRCGGTVLGAVDFFGGFTDRK